MAKSILKQVGKTLTDAGKATRSAAAVATRVVRKAAKKATKRVLPKTSKAVEVRLCASAEEAGDGSVIPQDIPHSGRSQTQWWKKQSQARRLIAIEEKFDGREKRRKRKYSKGAANKVKEGHEEAQGRAPLRSGRSGRKVKSRKKQAIAIGLSEARRAGKKVPKKRKSKKRKS